jgi:hypothetical protein
MDKDKLIALLSILEDNDCLHPEWNWGRENETETLQLTEDSEWVVDVINDFLEK